MRPGQTAPECRSFRACPCRSRRRFNEAGADCPGMRECAIAFLRRIFELQ